MSRESRSQYALLGLLSMGPMSGYDIKHWIDRALGYFWSESYGQIYPQLKRLERSGLATVSRSSDGGRGRNVYRITAKGRRALEAWLKEPTPPTRQRLEVLLKLFFAHQTDLCHARNHLQEELRAARAVQEELRAIETGLADGCDNAATNPQVQLSLITLRYGLGIARHTERWARDSLGRLEQLESARATGAKSGS